MNTHLSCPPFWSWWEDSQAPIFLLCIFSGLAFCLVDTRWLQHFQAPCLLSRKKEGGRRKERQHLFRKAKDFLETSRGKLQINTLKTRLFSGNPSLDHEIMYYQMLREGVEPRDWVQSWFYFLLCIWLDTSHLNFLGLNFLILKMRAWN